MYNILHTQPLESLELSKETWAAFCIKLSGLSGNVCILFLGLNDLL